MLDEKVLEKATLKENSTKEKRITKINTIFNQFHKKHPLFFNFINSPAIYCRGKSRVGEVIIENFIS
jgi:hypothetical protein